MWRGAPGPLLSFLFSRLQHLSQRSFHFPKKFQLRKKIPETITSKIFKPQKIQLATHQRKRNKEPEEGILKKNIQRKSESFEFENFRLSVMSPESSDDRPHDITRTHVPQGSVGEFQHADGFFSAKGDLRIDFWTQKCSFSE